MKPLKILYVDDEKLQHETIDTLFRNSSIKNNVEYFNSGNEFFFNYEDHQDADCIILDVEMPKMNGLQIAKKIRETNAEIPLVFITAYGQYAIKGYEVMAISYLLKPVTKFQIDQLLEKIVSLKEIQEKYVVLEVKGQTERIKENEIYSIEATGHTSLVSFQNVEIELKYSFKELSELLSKDFIQTHRSYLVNINHVYQIRKEDVLLDNQQVVPLSRRMRKQVLDQFVKHYKSQGYSL